MRLSHFRFLLEHFWQAFGADVSLAEPEDAEIVHWMGKLAEEFMLSKTV
jgi:hypothetical protein